MLWGMRQGDEVLRLPGADGQLRRWRLVVRDDGLTLTDWNVGQRLVGPVAAVFFWGWWLLYGVGLVATAVNVMGASPRSVWYSGGAAWLVVVLTGVLAALPGLLLVMLMRVLGVDRRSLVEVDRFGRRCVIKRWRWGWVTARREAALGAVDWEILPGVVRREVAAKSQVSLGQGLLTVVLMFTGPIGWVITILREFSRKGSSSGGSAAEVVEVVRLELVGAGPGAGPGVEVPRVRVTLAEEETAAAFLSAWDAARR